MFSPFILQELDGFSEVVFLDTEFVAVDGELVVPVALVAHELRSGRRHQLFFEAAGANYDSPLPQGPDVLYVAFSAQAEWSTFLALGWSLPSDVLDLFAEFRWITNGLTDAQGCPVASSLIAALGYFGLDSMAVVEKQSMRDLILRGHPYSVEEQKQILEYCAEDVEALTKLFGVMLKMIDLPYALFRGRYTKAVARMEASGTPMDTSTLDRLQLSWGSVKEQLALTVEAEHGFGVYEQTRWSDSRFAALLRRIGALAEWPRTESGRLRIDDDLFKVMAVRYPAVQPLRDLRSTLVHLRDINLTVGRDGRNRCSLMPFRSKTGRNYPASSKFIFGPSAWLRSLIKPEADRAIAYIDWTSAEFGIAAALSGDIRMRAAYESGDVYMTFAIDAGAAPRGATKHTHAEAREIYKVVVLAVQYGQGAAALANTLGVAEWQAKELLSFHRRIYSRYWQWIEWVSQSATFGRSIETVFRWPMHVTSRTKANTISNFPMQANGSEMLRWACTFATEQGIEVHAPVQDALLVGGASKDIEEVVMATRKAMAEASSLVLDGFVLRSDVNIVRYPDRYADKRGVQMWNRVMGVLNILEPAV